MTGLGMGRHLYTSAKEREECNYIIAKLIINNNYYVNEKNELYTKINKLHFNYTLLKSPVKQ